MATFPDWAEAARRFLEADAGRLWGISLATVPWVAVDGDRLLTTEDPGVAGFERTDTHLWRGPKPPELTAANTAVDWAGRRWAMCSLPLDPERAVRVLVHEAWHVIQPQLIGEMDSGEMLPGREIFDTVEGRVWLRLELAALGAALTTTGTHQLRAAAAALAFRGRRYALARAEERRRETLLDIAEGLAEYTAWRLTGAAASELAAELVAPAPVSWSRAFCYRTGPAYGYVLDDLAQEWRETVRTVRDLQELLGQAVRSDLDPDVEAAQHDVGAIRAEEAGAQAPIDAIKRRFITSKRLRIRPGQAGMQLAFDPRQAFGSDEGTIYGSLTWSDGRGGRLVAGGGALVTADWTEVWVPLGHATVGHGVTPGPGWTLELPETWQVRQEGASFVVEPLN